MAEINFYLLNQITDERECALWLCRWIEQRYLAGDSVLVLLPPSKLPELERLLWVFKDSSLVPHAQYTNPDWNLLDYPVALADHATLTTIASSCCDHFTWLVNGGDEALPAHNLVCADRVIELVPAIDVIKQRQRAAYRLYAQQGMKPVTCVPEIDG